MNCYNSSPDSKSATGDYSETACQVVDLLLGTDNGVKY